MCQSDELLTFNTSADQQIHVTLPAYAGWVAFAWMCLLLHSWAAGAETAQEPSSEWQYDALIDLGTTIRRGRTEAFSNWVISRPVFPGSCPASISSSSRFCGRSIPDRDGAVTAMQSGVGLGDDRDSASDLQHGIFDLIHPFEAL